jgi:methyl-accepting chemotaxis protein
MKLKFNQLLYLSFGILMFSMVFISGMSLYKLYQVAHQNEIMYDHSFTITKSVLQTEVNLNKIYQYTREAIFGSDLEPLEREIDKADERIRGDLQQIRERFLGESERVDMFEAQFDQWAEARKVVFEYARAGNDSMAIVAHDTQVDPIVVELSKTMNWFTENSKKDAAEFYSQSLGFSQRANLILIISVICGLVLSGVVIVMVSKRMLRILGTSPEKLAALVDRMTSGDLRKIDSKNPQGLLSSSIKLRDKMATIIHDITEVSALLIQAAKDLSDAAQAISSGVNTRWILRVRR